MNKKATNFDPKDIQLYITNVLNESNIKYIVHTFDADISMIDVWNNNSFYVLQIEKEFIGFSKVDDENIGFDTVPDLKFFDVHEFKTKFLYLVSP